MKGTANTIIRVVVSIRGGGRGGGRVGGRGRGRGRGSRAVCGFVWTAVTGSRTYVITVTYNTVDKHTRFSTYPLA